MLGGVREERGRRDDLLQQRGHAGPVPSVGGADGETKRPLNAGGDAKQGAQESAARVLVRDGLGKEPPSVLPAIRRLKRVDVGPVGEGAIPSDGAVFQGQEVEGREQELGDEEPRNGRGKDAQEWSAMAHLG